MRLDLAQAVSLQCGGAQERGPVQEVPGHAGAAHEAHVGAEALADVHDRVLRAQPAGLPADGGLRRGLPARFARRLRARGEAVEAEIAEHAEVHVGAGHPVEVAAAARGLARHHDGADVRRAEHVAADARHAVVLTASPAVRLALHAEQAQAVLPGATRGAHAAVQRHLLAGIGQADAAAEEQEQVFLRRPEPRRLPLIAGDVAEVERAGVLQEELALLGEEQAELGQVDLLLVGLGLREVGIDGDVEGQGRAQPGLHVEAGAAIERHVGLTSGAHGPAEHVGLHPDVAALRQVGQAGERAGRRGPHDRERARHRRPVGDLVLPPDPPGEVDAPVVPAARLEAQRLERNAELGRPAFGPDPAGHPPDGVPVRVHVAAFVGDLRIGSGPLGVGAEDEAVAPIGEGVEQHLEGVLLGAGEVLADLVDDDAGRIGIAAQRADVEIVGVVGHAHFGGLAGRLALDRIGLHEAGGRHRGAPDGLVEHAVDHDRPVGAGRCQHPPAVGRRHRERLRASRRRDAEQHAERMIRAARGGTSCGR